MKKFFSTKKIPENYYVPLASPKESDYIIDKSGEKRSGKIPR